LQTLGVRLAHIERSTVEIARRLSEHQEIARVLHPALPSCPGHEYWKRDFTGSSGVFSIVFNEDYSREDVLAFVDKLELFEIGYSWAGTTSLAVPYEIRSPHRPAYDHRLVRLSIGLEATDDLIADLENALG
jgi:cystathionine beta-lyase